MLLSGAFQAHFNNQTIRILNKTEGKKWIVCLLVDCDLNGRLNCV